MKVTVTSTSFNHVDWVVRRGGLPLWAGFLALAATIILLVAPGPAENIFRPAILGVVLTLFVLLSLVIVFSSPFGEHGFVERQPDSGEVVRQRVWPIIGPRRIKTCPLEDVEEFEIETAEFQEARGHSYPLARLWIITPDRQHIELVGWAQPDQVRELGAAVAKVSRKNLRDPLEHDANAEQTLPA